jgi:hypothetical protein
MLRLSLLNQLVLIAKYCLVVLFYRHVDGWNSLASNYRNINSLALFKSVVHSVDFSAFLKGSTLHE